MNNTSRPTTSIEVNTTSKMGAAASRSISGISVNSNNDAFSDISFRIVDQSRYPEILKLLYANFHPDEPMSRAVGMVDGSKQTNPILDDFALNGLKQNLSIMAIDSVTDNLLGVSINIEAKKQDEDQSLEDILDEYKHPRFKHILTVLYRVNQLAGNIYGDMETDVFFDIKMVTTDKQQRKGGLATELLRRSVELARNLGFKAVKTEATGLYSRKAFERLGFTVNAEYFYKDYISEEGEKVFESIANQHKCTTLMTKRILPMKKTDSIPEDDD